MDIPFVDIAHFVNGQMYGKATPDFAVAMDEACGSVLDVTTKGEMPKKIVYKKDLELLASLKGRCMRVPDLGPIFSLWPKNINKHYGVLKAAANDYLRSFNMTEKKLKKQIEIDYALAGSMMWQQANYNGLRTVTFFVIWLFNYDDEVAEPMGQHSDHSELARGVLRTAVSFVEHCLGLGRQEAIDLPKDPNISRFQVIGDQIRAAYTVEQRQLFFDEMKLYFHACEREQQALKSIINHVSLACAVNPDLQYVIDEAMMALQASVNRFDAIAETLLSRPSLSRVEKRNFQDLIRVYRENCAGNWTWSLVTTRYGIQTAGQEDGSILFVL
ncbi:hypothetical protein MMC19_000160 [Ptychographa xylographoides]|nr:hypothetical protein [Ptychographa xylographoides]